MNQISDLTDAVKLDDDKLEIKVDIKSNDSYEADFEGGLAGLPIQASGGVQLDLIYEFQLGIGVSRTEGVYLIVDNSGGADNPVPEVTVDLRVGLQYDEHEEPIPLELDLWGLQFKATDKVGRDEFGNKIRDEDGNIVPGTSFSGKLNLNIEPTLGYDDKLLFTDLGNRKTLDVFQPSLETDVGIDLGLEVGIGNLPRVTADLEADWQFSIDTQDGELDLDVSSAPSVGFKNIGLDVGHFLSSYIGPVIEKVDEYLAPIRPLLDVLTQEIPGLSDAAELFTGDKVRFIDLARVKYPEMVEDVLVFANMLDSLSDFANSLGTTGVVTFGDLILGSEDGESQIDLSKEDWRTHVDTAIDTAAERTSSVIDRITDPNMRTSIRDMRKKPSADEHSRGLGLTVDLWEEPANLFKLFVGETINIITWDIPTLGFTFDFDYSIPIWPVPPVSAEMGLEIFAGADLSVGFDTRGLKTGNFLDGFFFGDRERIDEGHDIPEFEIGAGAYAGASVGWDPLFGAKIWGELGITGNANWHDTDDDGKLYWDELEWIRDNYGSECILDFGFNVDFAIKRAWTALFGLFGGESTIWEDDIDGDSNEGNCPKYLPAHVSDGAGETNLLPNGEHAEEGTLIIHAGHFAHLRRGSSRDVSESFTITELAPRVFQVEGMGLIHRYSEVDRIYFDGGEGRDKLEVVTQIENQTEVSVPVEAHGGNKGDIIMGGSKADTISGGPGNDVIRAGSGNDTVRGGSGEDVIFGGPEADTIHGGPHRDFILGEDGRDEIHGGSGHDLIGGGLGIDELYGDGGHDLILGGTVIANDAQKKLVTTLFKDMFDANNETEFMAHLDPTTVRDASEDFAFGGNGNDMLVGDMGADVLLGGWGDDVVIGHLIGNVSTEDTDHLEGGPNDDFVCGTNGQNEVFGGTTDQEFAGVATSHLSLLNLKPIKSLNDVPIVAEPLIQDGYQLNSCVVEDPDELPGLFVKPPTVTIQGHTFEDIDGNGQHDEGEQSLIGVVVEIYDDNNELVSRVRTSDIDLNSNGRVDSESESGVYGIEGLDPGRYSVREVVPEGYRQTYPVDDEYYELTLDAGTVAEQVDFGNQPLAEIHGSKWDDLNLNGTRDPDEPGVSDITVYSDTNENGMLDDGEPSALTVHDDPETLDIDETGMYWLEDLEPGEHWVREVVPDGYVQTFPGTVVYSNDFETEPVGDEWSDPRRGTTPVDERGFLGEFLDESVSLHLTDLPNHEELTIEFDLYVIGSWEGNYRPNNTMEFDRWVLNVREGETLIDTTFSNADALECAETDYVQAFPNAYASNANHCPRNGAVENNTLGFERLGYGADEPIVIDSVYHLTINLVHSTAELTLDFEKMGGGSITYADEGWGLDNVVVSIGNDAHVVEVGPGEIVEEIDFGNAFVPVDDTTVIIASSSMASVQTVASSAPDIRLVANSLVPDPTILVRPAWWLYDIDLTSGLATQGPELQRPLIGISQSPNDGLLYGVTEFIGVPDNCESAELGTVDLMNGHFVNATCGPPPTVCCLLGSAAIEGDLDFDPTTGELYGIWKPDHRKTHSHFYRIDVSTGKLTELGSFTENLDLSAMAFDNSGRLFVLDTQASPAGVQRLLEMDKTDATIIRSIELALLPGQTAVPFGLHAGMDFHPLTGDLYVVDGLAQGGANSLRIVDVETGLTSLVGFTHANLAGLEFVGEYDLFFLPDGEDTIYAAAGNDTVYGDNVVENPQVINKGDSDDIFGQAGNDTIFGQDEDDSIWGSDPNLVLIPQNSQEVFDNDIINGGFGIDEVHQTINSNRNSNLILSDSQLLLELFPGETKSIDTLESIEKATLTGGQGMNFLNAASFDKGSVTLFGGDGDDELWGGSHNDVLNGGMGNDRLEGNDGNDTYLFKSVDGPFESDFVVENSSTWNDGGIDTLDFSKLRTEDGVTVLLDSPTQFAKHNNRTIRTNGAQTIENVIGSPGNDTIIGNALQNQLLGGQGVDQVDGGKGADTIDGGSGDDTLYGGGDNDTFVFSPGWGMDTITELAGNDTVDFSQIEDRLDFSIEVNRIDITDGANVVSHYSNHHDDQIEFLLGGANDDVFRFSGGANFQGTIDGGMGMDELNYSAYTQRVNVDLGSKAATGVQTVQNIEDVVGGPLDDNLIGDNQSNRLYGGPGEDSLYGVGGDDELFGGQGNDKVIDGGDDHDFLFGEGGNDFMMFGGSGNDTSDGGSGDDKLIGGNGDDTYRFGLSTISLREFDHVQEHIEGSGSDAGGTDTLDFSNLNSPSDVVVIDLSANSTTPMAAHAGRSVYTIHSRYFENAIGGSGNDIIRGNDSRNTLEGGIGNDLLNGLADNDILKGGPGNDRYVFDAIRSDEIDEVVELPREGDADELDFDDLTTTRVVVDLSGEYSGGIQEQIALQTGVATRTIRASNPEAIDNVIGSPGSDTIVGNNGNNRLEGRFGNDELSGGRGNDTLVGGEDSNTLAGGQGHDTYVFDSFLVANDTLIEDRGNIGNGFLSGGGVDTLDFTPFTVPLVFDLEEPTHVIKKLFGTLEITMKENQNQTSQPTSEYFENVIGANRTLDVHLPDGRGFNHVSIRRNGSVIEVYDHVARSVLVRNSLEYTTSVAIHGAANNDDLITVDYDFDGYFSVPNGVDVSGSGGKDRLLVRGDGYTSGELAISDVALSETTVRTWKGISQNMIRSTGFESLGIVGMLTIETDTINIGEADVTLDSESPMIILGAQTLLDGGTITSTSELWLSTGNSIQGFGEINASLFAEVASAILANGDLTLGDRSSPDGFVSLGELYVGPHTVTLNDADQAELGSFTVVGDDGIAGTLCSANGLTIDYESSLVGFGTISTPIDPLKPLINSGAIVGNSPTEPITLLGYIKGIGMLDNVDVSNATLDLGFSPAAVNVGSVIYGTNTKVIVELGGPTPGNGGYDQINHLGDVSLDGTLDVRLINNFIPSYGDVFDVVTWTGTQTGSFKGFAGMQFNNDTVAVVANYENERLRLVTTGPGDANLDGRVSFADFLILQNNFNKPGGFTNADFNLDGHVSFADFLILQNAFNRIYFRSPLPAVAAADLHTRDQVLDDFDLESERENGAKPLINQRVNWRRDRAMAHRHMVFDVALRDRRQRLVNAEAQIDEIFAQPQELEIRVV